MAQVLGQIQSKYAGQFTVQIYSIETDENKFKKYNVELVPTIIIEGPAGGTLYRHTGARPKEDLINTFKALNIIRD